VSDLKKKWDQNDFDYKYHTQAIPSFDVETGEPNARANRAIGDVGLFIQKDCGIETLKHLTYAGSAAVHIYAGKTGFVFITQTAPLKGTNEWLADKAFGRLKEDLKLHYGHKRMKATRSGV
jgi:hypothetical protein